MPDIESQFDARKEPCPETYKIGPFLFECAGTLGDPAHDPWLHKVEHRSRCARWSATGDAELVWWTDDG